MQKLNNHTIFQIELNKLDFFTASLLDTLTAPNPSVFGIKKDNYYMLNTNRRVNNFQQEQEVENFNMFLQCCAVKGFSLTMIKF